MAVYFYFVSACSSQTPQEQPELKHNRNPVLNKLNENRLEGFSKDNGKIQVYLVVKSVDDNEVRQLEETGVEIEIVNKKLHKIQATVDKDKLNELRKLGNVLSITKPSYGHLRSYTQ